MRFMVMVRATQASEADVMPSRELMEAMGAFNERLAADGMLVSAEGLKSSRAGARIAFGDGAPRVKRGPFAPPQSLIAGFWLIEAKSLDEVVARFSQCPNPYGDAPGEIEIRQAFGPDDFPAEIASDEVKARERALRDGAAARAPGG